MNGLPGRKGDRGDPGLPGAAGRPEQPCFVPSCINGFPRLPERLGLRLGTTFIYILKHISSCIKLSQ